MQEGKIVKVSGPLVLAENVENAKMFDMVKVGNLELIGEIVEIKKGIISIQVYEETSGLGIGEPVISTQEPLSVELGPGILENFYDGIQRPLKDLAEKSGAFISRGLMAPGLSREKQWKFTPNVKVGDIVVEGDILGTVEETVLITHKIMIPPGLKGKITKIETGNFKIEDQVAIIQNEQKEEISITMLQKWPVRKRRPYNKKIFSKEPLITGQRVIDMFFPIVKGGTACIPGPFGSGKTVTQHQLAKWSDAQIVVYIGCGERGNEMTDVLLEFPELEDPKSGHPLMKRTVLIANTSNMPVAAREASIYTGITIAEYFRDMGYDVALMADSTSRWAEAMREMSGRLEEMPGEEGYPPYLGTRIAEFYERAGRVESLGSVPRIGSVTAIGAVSPPGGDLSDPVVQSTLRVAKVFWGLDASLAYKRHFPAINWLNSYSLYYDNLDEFLSQELDSRWVLFRKEAMGMLQKEAELEEIAKLIGIDSLSPENQLILESTKSLREDFLHQNSFHEIDTFCSPKKMMYILFFILDFHHKAEEILKSEKMTIKQITTLAVREDIARFRYVPENEIEQKSQYIILELERSFNLEGAHMLKEYKKIDQIYGPIIIVSGVEGVKYDELVKIQLSNGIIRTGKVLEVYYDRAVIQLFEGASGIGQLNTKVIFQGESVSLGVSSDLLGRIFDGQGNPIDGGREIIPEKRVDINGSSINPVERDFPNEFIQTGISTIDGLNTLVRGQKLPIFSGNGMSHIKLAAQIAKQAKVKNTDDSFAVVFGAMGITFEENTFFREEFLKTGALERSVLFINLADDPAIERISTPRLALTAAEYLAFEKDMHVLVILIDMSNYCEALREISAARKEIPGRRGYPGYLYTDLANLYERAGRIKGHTGSITQIPILTMPEDDKTHPIPDLTGYITEGQIVFSRSLYKKGIYPSVDVQQSLSRLKDKGIGEKRTRKDHADVFNQLFAAYARGLEARELEAILGQAALSDMDKIFYNFAMEFENQYINQGMDENRDIQDTLNLGWRLLAKIPRTELKRIRQEYLDEFLPRFLEQE